MKQTFIPVQGICLHLLLILLAFGVEQMALYGTEAPVGLIATLPVLVIIFRLARRCCIIRVRASELSISYPLRIFSNEAVYLFEGISSVQLGLSDHSRGRFLSVLLGKGYARDTMFGDPYNGLHRHMFWRRQQLQIAAALNRFGVTASPLPG